MNTFSLKECALFSDEKTAPHLFTKQLTVTCPNNYRHHMGVVIE